MIPTPSRAVRRRLLASALALGLMGAAGSAVASDAHQGQAVPALSPAALMRLLAAMPTGDPARGEELHDTYWCSGCHGAEGIAWSRNYPSLAGQSETYLFKTMVDYRDGRRDEGDGTALSMKVTVTGLDDQALADLAAYYAGRPGPAPDPAAAGVATPPAVLELIKSGDPSRLMTPCASCHGVGGTGGKPEVPKLAGLERAYLERSLRLYHGGARASDTDSNMRFFAARLTDAEIAALATHYAGQGQGDRVASE
jgi:cytochrome c553